MKTSPGISSILLASVLGAVAGSGPDAMQTLEPSAPEPWLKPTVDVRLRYEFASISGKEDATALTIRERVGLQVGAIHGFTGFAEYEGTQLLANDFTTPASTHPGPGSRAGIADPESNELNRAWVQWEGMESKVKAGRQRIILDNAAHVGNVGWRQNEQTYDAAVVQTRYFDNFDLFYGYIDQVHRIFGSDAVGATRKFEGDTHLIHARWNGPEGLSVTGYAYLMDFDRTGSMFSNNTFGAFVEGPVPLPAGWEGKVRGEAAWQTDADSSPVDYEAFYGHLTVTAKRGNHAFTLGYEHLGADTGRMKAGGAAAPISFRTPLATAHAFNGFSDALLGARIGGTNGGIGDLYATYKTKLPRDLNLLLALHWFGEDDFGFGTGWEADAVLSRKLGENLTAIAKLAAYESESGNDPISPAPADTFRASLELNFVF